MIAKSLRLVLGILFLPVVAGYTQAFADQLLSIQQIREPELSFLLGVTAYLAFHVLLAVPNRAYVFSHELMHAAATWLSGGQVKGFKVGAKSGSVATNKVTAFIALAPYLVPVYAVLWAFAYGVATLFWNTAPWSRLFFFGLGATLTFHLVFTVTALKEKQSDLAVTGPVLALCVITWANLTLVTGVIGLIVPEVNFVRYMASGWHQSVDLYHAIFRQFFSA